LVVEVGKCSEISNFLTIGGFGGVVVTKLVLMVLVRVGFTRVLSRAISGFPALSVDSCLESRLPAVEI
jgi:hypothetical protein